MVLRWDEADFRDMAKRLNAAFRKGAAAFFYDRRVGAHSIDVFDPLQAGYSPEDWAIHGEVISDLYQYLIFAFADAPDDVVRRWAENHDEKLGDVAVERLRVLREETPDVYTEWHQRFTSVASVVGDIQAQVIFTPDTGQLQALINIDSFASGGAPRHIPVSGSRQWITAVASRNEVSRLVQILTDLRDSMPVLDLAEVDHKTEEK